VNKEKLYRILIAVDLIPKMKQFELHPPPITGFTISRLQYLISLILSHKQDNHPGAWSLLNMEYMKNIIPRADEYLKFLKDQGIIEWRNYSAGRNSRMYRLINEGRTDYRSISDRQLIWRIERNRRKIQLRNSKMYPILNAHIYKVKIDHEAALKTIESEYQKNIQNGYLKAEGRRTFSLAEIAKIQAGEIFIKVNKTNGRLDSNYTRLPSELVKHLTIDGHPLIEVDIRNSQPFFVAPLFNPTHEIEHLMNKYLGQSITMYTKSLQLSQYEDVKLYTSLVTKGEFYDPFLMEKFTESRIDFIDRDNLKNQMFVVFFGRNHADRYSRAAKLFRTIFPHVQLLFDIIKRDNHNKLAILLQRIESYTILKRVALRIQTQLPGMPFLTRHDSCLPSVIMVYKDSDKVKNIMLTTIKEVTGLTPTIRIKNGIEKPVENLIFRPNYTYISKFN